MVVILCYQVPEVMKQKADWSPPSSLFTKGGPWQNRAEAYSDPGFWSWNGGLGGLICILGVLTCFSDWLTEWPRGEAGTNVAVSDIPYEYKSKCRRGLAPPGDDVNKRPNCSALEQSVLSAGAMTKTDRSVPLIPTQSGHVTHTFKPNSVDWNASDCFMCYCLTCSDPPGSCCAACWTLGVL